MTQVATCLWLDGDAEAAARFYVSLFAQAELGDIQRLNVDTPGGVKAGEALAASFTLAGTPYMLLNGGPHFTLSPAASIMVTCTDPAEQDRLWDALLDGGTAMHCGWLTDRYGVSWQIIPDGLQALLADPDPDRARRATEAMMGMVKLDLLAMQAAARGD